MEKHQDLKRETGKLWKLKIVKVVSVVIGAIRSVLKEFDERIEKLRITNNVGVMQDCIVGNWEDIEKRVWDVKKRSFC